MFRDLTILCEQYDFSTVTNDVNEVNFFSGLNPTLLDTIDLTDYIEIDKSDVTFKAKREEIDREADSLKLFGTFDSIKLTLSNLETPSIFDFFALDNNDTNQFIHYKILAYNGTELIFQGILKSNDLRYNMPYEFNDRELVDVTIYEWGKEFKDYFSNGEMPDLSTPVNYWYSETFVGESLQLTTINSMLVGLFGFDFDNEIIYDDGIDNENIARWRIMRVPNMGNPTSPTDTNFWWLNGYDYVKSNQKLSSFDFFRKLCNGMGWLFYFKIVDNQMKFIVRNRVTESAFFNGRVIDNEDVIGYTTEYSQYRNKVKTIKIPVMQISGGNEIFYSRNDVPTSFAVESTIMHGAYDLVFSKEQTPPRQDLIYFQTALLKTGDNIYIRPIAQNGYGYSKYYSTDENTTRYENIFVNYTEDGDIDFIERFEFNYDNKFLLGIDGGHNDFNATVKRRKDLDNGTATDYESGDNISDTDIIYTGNIASSMMREQASSLWTQYIALNNDVVTNYSYTKSAQFIANMESLLTDDSNLILNIQVKGFYPYLDDVITFTNPNNLFPFGYSYDVISSNADYTNEVTEYSLRRRYTA